MQAERRLLAQEVFPTLRQRCIQLGVHLIEVDFGWGVPEEAAERKSAIVSRLLEMRQNVGCECMYVCVCMYACMCMCIVCMYVCMYVYAYVCMYVCTSLRLWPDCWR